MRRHNLMKTCVYLPGRRDVLATVTTLVTVLLVLLELQGSSAAAAAGSERCTANEHGQMDCGNLTVRLSQGDYEVRLKARERALRSEQAANRIRLERLRKLHRQAADTLKETLYAQIGTARTYQYTLAAELDELKRRQSRPHRSFGRLVDALSAAQATLDTLPPALPAATVEAASAALRDADVSSAEQELEAIAESLGQLLEPRDEKAALVNFQAGMLAEEWVDWRTAYQHYARAVDLEPENWRYAQQAGNLAWRVGEYETAADYHESVLRTVLAGFGTENHETATAMNALAIAYVALARYAEAEPLLRTASTISEKTLGEKHRDVATGYNNLAVLLEQQGKLDEAESTYRKALDIARSSLGRKHRDTRSTDRNLKQLLVERATTQSP